MLFSEIIVRTVTIVPANVPAMQRSSIICQSVRLNPKEPVANETPHNEQTNTGLRPKRSAALPQNGMSIICVIEKNASCVGQSAQSLQAQLTLWTYNHPRREANITLLHTTDLVNHLTNEWENGEEGDWLDEPRIAEQEDLSHR